MEQVEQDLEPFEFVTPVPPAPRVGGTAAVALKVAEMLGFALRNAPQVSGQRHHVATLGVTGEVGPFAGNQVDGEGTGPRRMG